MGTWTRKQMRGWVGMVGHGIHDCLGGVGALGRVPTQIFEFYPVGDWGDGWFIESSWVMYRRRVPWG